MSVNPRFPLFDSLRAIAALSVFAVHLPWLITLSSGNVLRPYLLQLNVGVALFFLISGFLLYRPFARARYVGSRAPAALPYAERRALRIVPAYWVALPLTVLLLGKPGVFTPHGLVSYFGFLQNYDSNTLLGGISAAWTLCVEVTFYAMLPLWAMLLRRIPCRSGRDFLRSELLSLAGLFVIGVAWTSVAATHEHPTGAVFVDVTLIQPWLYVLPAFLDHFALGMALAVLSVAATDLSPQPKALRVIDRAPWLPWLAAALAFFLLGHLAGWFPNSWATQIIAQHELQAVFAFALLLPAAFGDPNRGMIRKLLANRILLWIGLVSYGLYLWHAAIILKLDTLGALDALGSFGFMVVALSLSLLVAAASFYGIERRALRLGRRLSHRRRSQDADIRMRDLRQHERPEPGTP
jgi:peptidoglycan/LPS O-acetylase OafA/YrhL